MIVKVYFTPANNPTINYVLLCLYWMQVWQCLFWTKVIESYEIKLNANDTSTQIKVCVCVCGVSMSVARGLYLYDQEAFSRHLLTWDPL